ncbi:MAG: helix-turn-helix domain-containing protein [Clostridiales bacterium]|nr:helix-turn-helix domain-containing protein [Clostridiales bacterium]
MNTIGTKIKELRRRADLTQEQLADILGVAYQTVSKWECGTTSPDISMIAPIARFFKVSADELFGLSESADEARQRELRERWGKTWDSGDVEERYEISKQAHAEFPGNFEYLIWLADSEASYAVHCCERFSQEQKNHFEAAVKHYETVIENCNDTEMKNDAIYGLVMALPDAGRREEGVKYAKMHPRSDELLQWCLTGEEAAVHRQKMILIGLLEFVDNLEWGKTDIASLQAAEKIIKIIIDDGNYLGEHDTLMHNYIWQAMCFTKSGEYEKAIECLKKSYEHSLKFEETFARAKVKPQPYTCAILNKLTFGSNDICFSGASTLPQDFMEYLSWKEFDPLRDRDDFKALLKLEIPKGKR